MLWSRCMWAVLLLVAAHACNGARILGIFPLAAPSHQNILTSLTKGLAKNGHDITVVTPIPQKSLPPNYKEIHIENFMGNLLKSQKIDFYEMRHMSAFTQIMMLWGIGQSSCDWTLADPNVQALINSKDSYDLVLIEAFNNECFLGFAHKFQAPVIQISPMGAADSLQDAMGNPVPYAYIPDFSTAYTPHMCFTQRLHNTLLGVFKTLGRTFFYLPRQDAIIQKYFNNTGPGPLPYVTELNARTSLMLLNNHFSVSQPRPFLPNVIEVGGMHINPPSKLPKDLQKFMDDAKDGVIYFSMGSNLRSADLRPEKRDALLRAFSKLKQKVLWKWEDDTLPGQPANVKLSKWFPQSDLLAHPNVKVFITHGGLLSSQEAIYHGVPIIGIPIFGDQPLNMKKAVLTGYAIQLDYQDLSTEAVTAALQEVVNNPKYSETAKRLSRTFRDQPRTPLETAIFWTEYVLRHKGASHLRSAALDLAWYQYHLLDVLAVLAGAAIALLVLFYLSVRTVYRCCCGKGATKTTQSKKRN